MNSIHPTCVYDSINLRAATVGRAVRVFDTNKDGSLLPVAFTSTAEGFQLTHPPYGQIYVEEGNTDDDPAVVDDNYKSTDLAYPYDCVDVKRILRVFGFEAKHCTAFSLGCVGPDRDLIFSVSKYVTKGEMRALAEELEANPPAKKETP